MEKVREVAGKTCLCLDQLEARCAFQDSLLDTRAFLSAKEPSEELFKARNATAEVSGRCLGRLARKRETDAYIHYWYFMLFQSLLEERNGLMVLRHYISKVPKADSSIADRRIRVWWWTQRSLTKLEEFMIVEPSERDEALAYLRRHASNPGSPALATTALEKLEKSLR
jgi:hypothetical protein